MFKILDPDPDKMDVDPPDLHWIRQIYIGFVFFECLDLDPDVIIKFEKENFEK